MIDSLIFNVSSYTQLGLLFIGLGCVLLLLAYPILYSVNRLCQTKYNFNCYPNEKFMFFGFFSLILFGYVVIILDIVFKLVGLS